MKSKIFLMIGFALSLLIFSCESSESSEVNNKTVDLLSRNSIDKNINGGVEFQCIGSCECGFGLDLNTMTGACTCSPCALEIKFVEIKDNKLSSSDKEVLRDNLINSELLKVATKDINEYALEKYDVELNSYKKLELYHNDGNDVVIFTFEDSQRNTQTVLYSRSLSTGKAFRVDCTGSCDCREQFNFNTNTASCSCSDCTMTVTEIKDLSPN